jgi:hypothetical protein
LCCTRSGHMEHDTLRVQHKKALKESNVRPFVIYSFRHTFLTGLVNRDAMPGPWRESRDTPISPSRSGMFTPQRMRFYRQCPGLVGTILGTLQKWRFRKRRKQRL